MSGSKIFSSSFNTATHQPAVSVKTCFLIFLIHSPFWKPCFLGQNGDKSSRMVITVYEFLQINMVMIFCLHHWHYISIAVSFSDSSISKTFSYKIWWTPHASGQGTIDYMLLVSGISAIYYFWFLAIRLIETESWFQIKMSWLQWMKRHIKTKKFHVYSTKGILIWATERNTVFQPWVHWYSSFKFPVFTQNIKCRLWKDDSIMNVLL